MKDFLSFLGLAKDKSVKEVAVSVIQQKVYTAEEIHAAMIAYVASYVEDVKSKIDSFELAPKSELMVVPNDLQNEYDKLKSLGLENTKNALLLKSKLDDIEAHNEQCNEKQKYIQRLKDTLEFIKQMNDFFGKKAVLVRFDDFEKLINKYNLACGVLSDYTGSIPQENVEDIQRVKTLIENSERKYTMNEYRFIYPAFHKEPLFYGYPLLSKHIKELCRVKEIYYSLNEPFTSEEKDNLGRFPFVIRNRDGFWSRDFAPSINRDISCSIGNEIYLFIAAPAQQMNTKVEFTERVISQDPFICSYSDFGIIIHSKWGEEAEDEILKKYYDLIK